MKRVEETAMASGESKGMMAQLSKGRGSGNIERID